MRRRYNLPTDICWNADPGGAERARIERVIRASLQRVIENLTGEESVRALFDMTDRPEARDRFSPLRNRPERETYLLPSYDGGGAHKEAPLKPQGSAGGVVGKAGEDIWTKDLIVSHIEKTYGSLGPRGQTFYGVMTPKGLFFVDSVRDDQPQLDSYTLGFLSRDVEGHWNYNGQTISYSPGRYIYRVVRRSENPDSPRPFVAVVTDGLGNQVGKEIWTSSPVGYQLMFDVPASSPAGGPGDAQCGGGIKNGGIKNGSILPEPGASILFQCSPQWDTTPLSDPRFASMSDDDLWRLFINLCNARAIHNLDLSEKYIRDQLVPRFTGPGSSPLTRSDATTHELKHFQERLGFLRGLMFVFNHLDQELQRLRKEHDDLVLNYQSSAGFGVLQRVNPFAPIYGEPAPRDAQRASKLIEEIVKKDDAFKTTLRAIIKLIQEEPLLTQFVQGLATGHTIQVPDQSVVSAELADIKDPAAVQRRVVEELDRILLSIASARAYLCRNPERILDVPIVYRAVIEDLRGINPRFDEVAKKRSAQYKRQEAWTEIGLSGAGLALFVGGLLVSSLGGPAGVVTFLGVAGSVLGGVQALRSLDRAAFATTLSQATVEQESGLVTLAEAKDARFWATVDSVFVGVDVVFRGAPYAIKALTEARLLAQARHSKAVASLGKAAGEFNEALAVGSRADFETIFTKAAPKGRLNLSLTELQSLDNMVTLSSPGAAVNRGNPGHITNLAGRIAEEAVERAVLKTGDYFSLASKLKSDNGIDCLFIRRSVFERVFGQAANNQQARQMLARATKEQSDRLLKVLKEERIADDLVSVEVKFNVDGRPTEELLKEARRGVQQDRVWHSSVVKEMIESKNTDLQASGRLLSQVIGSDASLVDRIARIGITVNPTGVYSLTNLTDDMIHAAFECGQLYRSPLYYEQLPLGLLAAERAGNAAEADVYRLLLRDLQERIKSLDMVADTAKKAHEARRQAALSLQKTQQYVAQAAELSARPPTPGVTQALQVANSLLRTYAQEAKHKIEEAESGYRWASSTIESANRAYPQYKAQIELLKRQHPDRFK
jgi:hypothetical protein